MKIPYTHSQNSQQAFEAMKKKITPEYLAQFKVCAEVKYLESSNRIEAKGQGFTLLIDFSSSDCELGLDLSFLLKPFKSKILDKIGNELKTIV